MSGKVTGIGGIFFVAKDPKKLYSWYEKCLGLKVNEYGFLFEKSENPADRGYLQLSAFSNNDYMQPSKKDFMINFRVDDLNAILEKLEKEGTRPTKEVERFDYGNFAHILDPEGNKIELWEPVDAVMKEYADKSGTNTAD